MKEIIEQVNINDEKLANEILILQKESYKIEADLISYNDLPPLKESIQDLLNSNEKFLIFKDNNKIYGVLSFEILDQGIDICKLFISPKILNKGIGSKLIKNLQNRFNNVKYIIVQTGLKNIPAINFYKKHGFQLIKVIKMEDGLEIAKFKKNIIHIRVAEEKDVSEIKDLLTLVWKDTYKSIIPDYVIQEVRENWHSIKNLTYQIKNENTIFTVAEENNIIIGMLTAKIENDKCFLSRLYILPNNQRKGIGKKLLNNLIESFKFKEMLLDVEEENKKGIGFYEKEEFTIVDKHVVKVLDFDLKTLVMSKKFHAN